MYAMKGVLTKKKELDRRWEVVVGALVCQFCVGMLYSWSVFQNPIVTYFGWETSAVSLAFSISTFMMPIAMIVGGILLPKWGPGKVAKLGGLILTIALLITSNMKSLPVLYFGFGFLGGIGVGLVYGVPIATCAGWFPEKTGMITGLAVAGFGLGSSVYAPIASHLIEMIGVFQTFRIQAVVAFVGILIGSSLMKAPRSYQKDDQKQNAHDVTPAKMMGTKQFWILFVMYIFANAVGLMMVGHASPMGQQLAGLTTVQAGVIVSILAVSNTAGRFLGGFFSDRFGAFKVIFVLYGINAIFLLLIGGMHTYFLFSIAVAVLACSFGAMVGAYPSVVLKFFGRKHYSVNYGIVFMAFGIGGILGPQIASQALRISGGSYAPAFWIGAMLSVFGAAMTLFMYFHTTIFSRKNE